MRSPNSRHQTLNIVGLKEKCKFAWNRRFALQDKLNQTLDRDAKQIRQIHVEQYKFPTQQAYAPCNTQWSWHCGRHQQSPPSAP